MRNGASERSKIEGLQPFAAIQQIIISRLRGELHAINSSYGIAQIRQIRTRGPETKLRSELISFVHVPTS